MVRFLKKLLIKAIIYFRGMTFYETQMVPRSPFFKKLEVETVHGHEVRFFFYEEDSIDIQYRFGAFRLNNIKVCLLQAAFDEETPAVIHKYNNLKIMLKKGDLIFNDDDLISEVLLSAYLDFILSKEDELRSQ